MRLERLTFVHDGDPGTIGRLISDTRGLLRFGIEGSGLLDLASLSASQLHAQGSVPSHASIPGLSEAAVRIQAVSFSALPEPVRAELGEGEIPCLLGHSGVSTVTLLNARSCARVLPSLSDLRGKVRYALARVAWAL